MRTYYQFIIYSLLLFTSNLYAMNVFVQPLYWRATEAIDWAYTNNRNPLDENISYKTIEFSYSPGIRLGIGTQGNWDNEFYYTNYYTKAKDSTSGIVTPGFMGAKLAVPATPVGYAYQSGQIDFGINYNMLDWDLSKRFYVNKALMLRPIVGLSGGWIDQNIDTKLQGTLSVTEKIQNNFEGLGPKVGIGTEVSLLHSENTHFNFVADFTTAYLWGHWDIKDVAHDSLQNTIDIKLEDQNMGAVVAQAMLGLALDYKKLSLTLGYEINDYFNQFQIFDDATGAHDNDFVLQGLSFKLVYQFA